MIVLGIDPGFARIGYGVVEREGSRISLLEADILRVLSPKTRFTDVARDLNRLIRKFKPEVMGIERLYFSRNRKTALQVAEMRGVIMMAAVRSNLAIREYSPNEVKMGITGYGLADKKAVAKMVRVIFKTPTLSVLDDVTDALALAYLASQRPIGP